MKRRSFILTAPAFVAGCAIRRGPPPPSTRADVEELTRGIVQMGGGVDIAEARAAATLSFRETHRLALAYQITGGPLLHNAMVNTGRKPRGLCWHWAEDLEASLSAQGYRSLRMHRAIANADSTVRIDHSTAIIAAAGAPWQSGIVLDPWRNAGVLHWALVRDDTHYKWEEREAVMRRYGRIRYVKQGALPA